jgi:signal transduction histidine kinase
MKTKLSLFTALITVMLISISSLVFMFRSAGDITKSLIERGLTLVRSISLISANAIAGYQYIDVQKALEATVIHDREIAYAYLENMEGVPLVFKDKIVTNARDILDHYGKLDRVIRRMDRGTGKTGEENIAVTLLTHGSEKCIDVRATVFINSLPQAYLRLGLTTRYIQESLLTGLLITILLTVFFIAAGIISSMIFSGIFTRPILRLRDEALELGKRNFDREIEVRSNDEIGLLAQTFNSMRLDIKRYTASLNEMIRKLEELDKLKTDFMTSISHELRTPVTSIIGFAHISISNMAVILGSLPENIEHKVIKNIHQQNQVTGIILEESKKLAGLISNVIDLMSLESGRLQWEIGDFDMAQLILEETGKKSAEAEAKGLQLSFHQPELLFPVRSDRKRVAQVIENLLDNAIKFTSSGSIVCSVVRKKGALEVSVTDTGTGIAPQEIEAVFEKFRQSGNILTGKPRGLGLGLAVSKGILENLGGRIYVESRPGEGSRFVFTIPTADSSEEPDHR